MADRNQIEQVHTATYCAGVCNIRILILQVTGYIYIIKQKTKKNYIL